MPECNKRKRCILSVLWSSDEEDTITPATNPVPTLISPMARAAAPVVTGPVPTLISPIARDVAPVVREPLPIHPMARNDMPVVTEPATLITQMARNGAPAVTDPSDMLTIPGCFTDPSDMLTIPETIPGCFDDDWSVVTEPAKSTRDADDAPVVTEPMPTTLDLDPTANQMGPEYFYTEPTESILRMVGDDSLLYLLVVLYNYGGVGLHM